MALLKRGPTKEQLDDVQKKYESELKPPDINPTITKLIHQTSHIHAGFLFDEKGNFLRQALCQHLTASNHKYIYAGWEDFAAHLGVSTLQIQCIRNNFSKEDPTELTLAAFVQYDHATLDKIVTALRDMERFDVLRCTSDLMFRLSEDACRSHRQRLSSEERYSSFTTDSESTAEDLNLIRPAFTIPVPITFRNLDVTPWIKSEAEGRTLTSRVEEESYVQATPTPSTKPQETDYGCIVLLTFAADGQDVAKEVAKVFRKSQNGQPRIGVVILNDHADLVLSNPEQFLSDCFEQIDYVVPIVTPGYLKAVTSTRPCTESSLLCIDTKFTKIIYRMMTTDYMRNGCFNKKIRCLVPDDQVYLTEKHPVMGRLAFQVWERVSNANLLGHLMLAARV